MQEILKSWAGISLHFDQILVLRWDKKVEGRGNANTIGRLDQALRQIRVQVLAPFSTTWPSNFFCFPEHWPTPSPNGISIGPLLCHVVHPVLLTVLRKAHEYVEKWESKSKYQLDKTHLLNQDVPSWKYNWTILWLQSMCRRYCRNWCQSWL